MSDTISTIFGVAPPKVFVFPKKEEYTAFKINPVNPNLIVGVELETENLHFRVRDDFVNALGKIGFWYTTDGSLRGQSGEFISLPMKISTLIQALDKYRELTDFSEANFTDRCSVHVHVNCTDLTVDNLTSLSLVYTAVEDVLFKFVGRDREQNIYCIPWSQCRDNLNLVNYLLSGRSSDAARSWRKYTALNLLPLTTLGTVEFRHMYGTLDQTVLSTWLNIIGSLFNYSTTTPSAQVIEEIQSLNSTSQYESFFTRVLGGVLPYNQEYSHMLESGVILAKYSLSNKPVKRGAKSTIISHYEAVSFEPPLMNNLWARANGATTQDTPGLPLTSDVLEQISNLQHDQIRTAEAPIRRSNFNNLWVTARAINAARTTPPVPENNGGG